MVGPERVASRYSRSNQPDAREAAIITTARETSEELREPYVVGRLWFRFDPGFQRELRTARLAWQGSADVVDRSEWSSERRFTFEADYTRSRRLREVAARLAIRWGLDIDQTIHAVAIGASLNYPYYGVRPDLTDSESGLIYTEVRVYTEFVWSEVRRALEGLPERVAMPTPHRFPDESLRKKTRVSGKPAEFAARCLALHFLTEESSGERETGGRRSWDEAQRLWWREHDVDEEQDVGYSHWLRDRHRLLEHVARRRLDPVTKLMRLQDELGLGDEEWAEAIGVPATGPGGSPTVDTWLGTKSEISPTQAFWDKVAQARPDLADDVLFHI
jgi:hypothetical protein